MSARCDVVIPVKDSVWWVDWCLAEVFRTTDPALLGKVVVVDDGSTTDSSAVLKRICDRYPDVVLTANASRPGFGGACNHGIALTDSRYFLLLNTDCLLAPRTIAKLVAAMERDPTIGLASPLSNNSPVLSLPMLPGLSYRDMNDRLEQASAGQPPESVALEACTVVGNCLAVSRACWSATGSFDALWGAGYGEETDYQFRAMEQGFRGAALVDTYVYHFGSASFRYHEDLGELRQRALALFHSKWGAAYRGLQETCRGKDPVEIASARLAGMATAPIGLDFLFVLPGIGQGVGGIHAVLDTCNSLIRSGRRAACTVPGPVDAGALARFSEPILFGLLDERRALHATAGVTTRLVVTTLYSTTMAAWPYARRLGVPLANWVQGYEFYFENGIRWSEVEAAYRGADAALVTSRWLEEGVRRHTPDTAVWRVPVGANPDQFFPGVAEPRPAKLRLGVVLRNQSDKGQWILLEVLQRLQSHRQQISLRLLAAEPYEAPAAWMGESDTRVVRLPLDRERVAAFLRECDVLVDASLHEGFGLLPLEAMMCGATVVVSSSGGVGEFIRDGVNGIVIREANDPVPYADAILRLADDPPWLERLKAGARQTSASFHADACDAQRASALDALAAHPWRAGAQVFFGTGEAQGYPGLEPAGDLLLVEQPSILLRMSGPDPQLLLAAIPPGAPAVVARLDMTVANSSTVQLYAPSSSTGVPGRVRQALRQVRAGVASNDRPNRRVPGVYIEEGSAGHELRPGRNEVYLALPGPFGPGAIRFDPATAAGECAVTALEVRVVEPLHADALRSTEQLQQAFGSSKHTIFGASLAPGDLVPVRDVTVESVAAGIRSVGPRPRVLLPPLAEHSRWPAWLTLEIEAPEATIVRLIPSPDDEAGAREPSLCRTLAEGWNAVAFVVAPLQAGRMCLELGSARGPFRLENVALLRPRATLGAPPSPPPGGGRISPQLATPLS